MDIYFDENGQEYKKPDNIKPTWRISGYALIESDKKEILVVQPTWNKKWELPGGGIEMNEAIRIGVQRECYEETGYRIEVQEQPMYVGERDFYCKALDKYFKSIVLIYSGRLISEKQDKEVVNTVERNEIAKIEWVSAEELNEINVQPIVWPVISKFMQK